MSPSALAAWERQERPLTDHTQRMSCLPRAADHLAACPARAFFNLAGRSKWMVKQRTLTARHTPTGTEEAG